MLGGTNAYLSQLMTYYISNGESVGENWIIRTLLDPHLIATVDPDTALAARAHFLHSR